MFELVRQGAIELFESGPMGIPGLQHAFLTRNYGVSPPPFNSLNFSVMEGDTEQNVNGNWERLAGSTGIGAERFLTLKQVHGDRILHFKSAFPLAGVRAGLEYDAVISDARGIALCIKTADCTPVLLADRELKAVAAVHAGWRGTSLQIARKAAQMMCESFGIDPAGLLAAIGPSICSRCYEVDSPVRDAMTGVPGEDLFVPCGPGKWKFDLPGANRLQLLKAGVPESSIFLSGLCTACRTDLFFSHRVERRTGRQLNFIMIDGQL